MTSGDSVPQFLPDDVPAGALLQEPPVRGGGEPAVGDPDDLAEHPVPHVGLDLPDQRRIGRVAGPGPDPDGDAVAGDGHADHDLRQVVTAVLGLAVGAEPRCLARVGVLLVAGLLAAPVPHGFRVGVLHLEVCGGGVEEQQVHFEVQQVRDLVEDLLFEIAADGVQPVHRPVARVVGDSAEAVDVHILAHPLRRGELGRRGQRPVGDQPEQHPLGCGGVPRPARVVNLPAAAQHGTRGQVDDPAVALVDHVLLRGPARQERTAQVYAEHCVPVLPGHLEQQVVADHASIVDQPRGRPQVSGHRAHCCLHLVSPADIGTDRDRLTASRGDGIHGGTASVGLQVERGDRHPVPGQAAGCGSADPAGRTGDYGDPAQVVRHLHLLLDVNCVLSGSRATFSLRSCRLPGWFGSWLS